MQINPIFLYNFGQKWLDTLQDITKYPFLQNTDDEYTKRI